MARPANTADGSNMRPSSVSTTAHDRDAVDRLKMSLLGSTGTTITNSKIWRAGLRALAAMPVEQRAELLERVENDSRVQVD